MPRRWSSTKEYRAVYKLLALRDGERCGLCGKSPPNTFLKIDHINGNEKDKGKDYGNLRLLCQSCNVKEGYRRRRPVSDVSKNSLGGRTGGEGDGGRDGEGERQRLRAKKDRLGFGDETAQPESRANREYEPVFRGWVLGEVWRRARSPVLGPLTREDAIAGGAEESDCSTKTAREYLRKMTSPTGPLQVVWDARLGAIIVPRATKGRP